MLSSRDGFTIVEVIVALLILTTAVLGLAGSATRLTTAAAGAERRAQALYAAEDRIGRIEVDGRYAALDSLYSGVESDVPLPGFTRTTSVEHVLETTPAALDYKIVSVLVAGPGLTSSIERHRVVAAP